MFYFIGNAVKCKDNQNYLFSWRTVLKLKRCSAISWYVTVMPVNPIVDSRLSYVLLYDNRGDVGGDWEGLDWRRTLLLSDIRSFVWQSGACGGDGERPDQGKNQLSYVRVTVGVLPRLSFLSRCRRYTVWIIILWYYTSTIKHWLYKNASYTQITAT